MQNYIKLIILLVFGGFCLGAVSGGNIHSINFNNLNLSEIEKFINSIDFGPFNGIVQDMKEALKLGYQELMKLINSAKQG